MTRPSTTGPTLGQRWRGARWVLLALAVIVAFAALSAYLTAPRPGGRMDPTSTSPEGARALVSLVRDRGVEVVEAHDIAAVEEAAARPDTLLVVVQTYHLVDDEVLRRLAALPGDRLLVEPMSKTREALAPQIETDGATSFGGGRQPDCDMREATRAGAVRLGMSTAYEASGDIPLTRCYEGALVRYSADGRQITVVGTSEFMTNDALADDGNAALAMNLTGTQPRMIWYAPQFTEGESGGGATLFDLIPDQVWWIVWQLVAAVALVALWKARRVGPLVAERLPVVVRASETVEGRGRLYRARRARDRAADALRTAALQRIVPRLGLGRNTDAPAVTHAVAAHCAIPAQTVTHVLFGPPPGDDAELVHLARELDNIERQVAQS